MDITLIDQNNRIVKGTDDDDKIILDGSGHGNKIDAGAGNDTIQAANYTNNIVHGGDGNDNISGFGSGSTIYGDIGADTIDFSNPVDGASAFGGDDDDLLSVSTDQARNVTLDGGAGVDTLSDNATAVGTVMRGGAERDSITVLGTKDKAYGDSGNDFIGVYGSGNSAFGGDNQDQLFLYSDGNMADGQNGNDYLEDNGFVGTLIGGSGNDTLEGSNALTTLNGGAGTDLFYIKNVDTIDNLRAGVTSIADFRTGIDKVQMLDGGAPTSYSEVQLHGGLGQALTAASSTVDGGYTFVAGSTDGFLIHNTAGKFTAVTIDGANSLEDFAGTDIKASLGGTGMNITLIDQSNRIVKGTDDDDNIILDGTGHGNKIDAGAGNDTIHAADYYTNNIVHGGDGNDNISGFGSGSKIYGDIGADTIDFSNPVNGASAFGGDDGDFLSVSTDQARNVTLDGGAGFDFLLDNATAVGTIMRGGAERDSISVLGTKDKAYGDSGDDLMGVLGSGNSAFGGDNQDEMLLYSDGNLMDGQNGNDYLADNGFAGTLIGGNGNDTLDASNAQTTLEGGAGKDVFQIDNFDTIDNLRAGVTSIADFRTGIDKVRMLTGGAPTSYSEVQFHGGLGEALTAASSTVDGGYTFAAGSTDGFLVHNIDGKFTAVTIDGANSLKDFAATDIKA